MDLTELRQQIDNIDEKILELFEKRMEVCKSVAEYKKQNKLPVMQGNREAELLARVTELSPDYLKNGTQVLFSSIMDISKCIQQAEISKTLQFEKAEEFCPDKASRILCQGTKGSYSEKACRKVFVNQNIDFVSEFEDVFRGVDSGKYEYGILPLENSTVGSVHQTYDLMAKYDFYINALIKVDITHCLAVKKGTELKDIKAVYSHEQALAQCSHFLKENNLVKKEYLNTALSAKLVSESDEKIACICSKEAAENFGLEILEQQIADVYPNSTRFICFSKKFIAPKKADLITVSLSIPNTRSSLYRLLTKFSVNGLNLEKLENKPIAGKDFEVIFYLDFRGNYNDKKVAGLIDGLSQELSYFKFLGNFNEIK